MSSAQVFRHFNLHINTEKVDRQSRQCTACDFVCARVINGRLICARGPFHYGLETKVNSLHSLLFLHLHTHTLTQQAQTKILGTHTRSRPSAVRPDEKCPTFKNMSASSSRPFIIQQQKSSLTETENYFHRRRETRAPAFSQLEIEMQPTVFQLQPGRPTAVPNLIAHSNLYAFAFSRLVACSCKRADLSESSCCRRINLAA